MSNRKYAVLITILTFYWAFMIWAPMANSTEPDEVDKATKVVCEYNNILTAKQKILEDFSNENSFIKGELNITYKNKINCKGDK